MTCCRGGLKTRLLLWMFQLNFWHIIIPVQVYSIHRWCLISLFRSLTILICFFDLLGRYTKNQYLDKEDCIRSEFFHAPQAQDILLLLWLYYNLLSKNPCKAVPYWQTHAAIIPFYGFICIVTICQVYIGITLITVFLLNYFQNETGC